ncbi:MAG: iron chelate uptake ABC transporter family permease subunit, partial [Parasporobacterium sp.]|nr:iron chelate uptake ABC transporter family permease subunit [Parasporobacterium sp.]
MKIAKSTHRETFPWIAYVVFLAAAVFVAAVCVALGSVQIPLKDVGKVVWQAVFGGAAAQDVPNTFSSIILTVRLPRVICVALTGASLSVCGASMQGLLKNALADGSTLGVSSGASLGAVLSIAFGITIPSLPFSGTMIMAILFAFGSLLLILGLSYKLDNSLSTNTIILVGIIFSMFVSSVMTLVIYFAG